MKRRVFQNLEKYFNENFTLLPLWLRFIPALVFYFHYYLDITKINYLTTRIKNRSKINKIEPSTTIVYFEDGITHQSLIPFYKQFDSSQIVLLNEPGRLSYRSEFLEFVLAHNFSKAKIIHILTLENFSYSRKITLEKFKKLPQKKIATVHLYMADDEIVFLSKYFDKLIVFNKYQLAHLNNLGVFNAECISHPLTTSDVVVDDRIEIKNKFNISDDKLVLTIAGYIRQDKGIDFLIDSLDLLEKKYKDRIFLNVAGQCIFLNSNLLRKKLDKLDIEKRINLVDSPLSKKELVENIVVSDYFLLPYNRKFMQISAQLLESAWWRVPVIASDYSPLGDEVKEYSLGYVFESGNSKSLVELLKNIIDKNLLAPEINPNYFELLNQDKIRNKYINLYKSILNEKI
jgi:glycosyltransferase involved in cell wall biosynthesis